MRPDDFTTATIRSATCDQRRHAAPRDVKGVTSKSATSGKSGRLIWVRIHATLFQGSDRQCRSAPSP
jgi:hypothetical protein